MILKKYSVKEAFEEIEKNEFSRIMYQEACKVIESHLEEWEKKDLSEITGVNIRKIKAQKLSLSDKMIIRNLCLEYLNNFDRPLYRHNAKCSGCKILPEWVKYS